MEGIVQGVGFRPFVHALATRLELAGQVANDGRGVDADVEGSPEAVAAFVEAVRSEAPPLAVVERVTAEPLPPTGRDGFTIVASETGGERTALVSPDTATCADCLRELFDPADRRFRYPFINCTNCGPRFTIIRDIPYDRPGTTMAGFTMCPECAREYHDPADRRFHAQPVCCPACGPTLRLLRAAPRGSAGSSGSADPAGRAALEGRMAQTARMAVNGRPGAAVHGAGAGIEPEREAEAEAVAAVADPDPDPDLDPGTGIGAAGEGDVLAGVEGVGEVALGEAVRRLAAGAILAVKGLGGYHLAAVAACTPAVAALRERKHREDKPFAVMVADLAAAASLCELDEAAVRALTSPRRPIVLLRRRPGAMVADAVAPGTDELGLMLPYTPLHHLLAAGLGVPFVLTSGNVSDEPIAYRDDEALRRLAGIADAFLVHDRPIHMRVDDSVVRIFRGRELPVRRSRGYAPRPVPLARPARRPVLGCGAELKNTFCLASGDRAFVSHHIGDLENAETLRSFTEGVAHFSRLFDITPQVVAHDLHPEYLSTKHALDLADATGVELVGVQHHHAHIASCLADNGEDGPVIGVAFDGLGLGPDGTLWGGEYLVADCRDYQRVGSFTPVPMPGGAAAIRQPWRMAAAYLAAACGTPAHTSADLPCPGDREAPAAPADPGGPAGPAGLPVLTALADRDELACLDDLPVARRNADRWAAVLGMAATGLNAPPTSSVGRLFDAVSALLGVRDVIHYEGQAAIELERLARRAGPTALAQPDAALTLLDGADGPAALAALAGADAWEGYRARIDPGLPTAGDARSSGDVPGGCARDGEIFRVRGPDLVRQAAQDLRAGVDRALIAARFHAGVVAAVVDGAALARRRCGLSTVALSGGVFQNMLLLDGAVRALERAGFRVLTHSRVPPNDGGISLGQVAVAAARDAT